MPKPRRWFSPWRVAFLLAAAGLLVRNLYGLDSSPPGTYIDEASIGYNAWSIAHYGVDEHDHHWPLFFQAFGEYKNPVYIYLLVPFVRVFGLTIAVTRTPAALLGFFSCLAITATVWHLFRSRPLALLTLIISAFTPWLSQESRLGFEVISMVAATSIALYCLARAVDGNSRWLFATGLALVFVLYAYTSGRIEAAGLTVVIAASFWLAHKPKWWLVLICPATGYALLLAWAFANPGALTNRIDAISIAAHAHSFSDVVHSFVFNYLGQIGPSFLFLSGDQNLRHNTGFNGELMVLTAPFLLAGIVVCLRRWREPFLSICLAGLVSAPVAAAVTANGNPHSLRAATMIPFAIVMSMYGIRVAGDYLRGRWRTVGWVVLAGLLIVEGVAYTADEFGAYETRSAVAFDSGIPAAIADARTHADGHRVFLSADAAEGEIYILAFFANPPPPPQRITGDEGETFGLAHLHMVVADPLRVAGRADDEMVLGAADPKPMHSTTTYVARDPSGRFLARVVTFD